MHGWTELAAYSPGRTLFIGTATALSFWGLGRILCGHALRSMPCFLALPAQCVAGVLSVSLVVQGLAMCNGSSPFVLRILWIALAAGGSVALVSRLIGSGSLRGTKAVLAGGGWWIPALLLAVALLL